MFVFLMIMIGLMVFSGIYEDDGDKNKGIWVIGFCFNWIVICWKWRGYYSMNISFSVLVMVVGKLRVDLRFVVGVNVGKVVEVMLGDI